MASGDNIETTRITYLPEKTFLPFLQMSDNNRIEDYGLHLECNDFRNTWLKNKPNELKNIRTADREKHWTLHSLELRCANNKNFNKENNFSNCTIRYCLDTDTIRYSLFYLKYTVVPRLSRLELRYKIYFLRL